MTDGRYRELLALLESRRVCLPAFDIGTGQTDFLMGVLSACQAARCPALLLVWPAPEPYLDLAACVDLVRSVGRRASVPVLLHLDHAKDEAALARALELGFDGVMFDGSALPLEENIRRTKAAAELAHAHGAVIEGELGRIGAELGDGYGAGGLTDPDEAGAFVRQTGVDILAPAVGNAHGFYRKPPELQFGLIERLAAAAGVPLSLHGGTGIPAADVRRAATLGFRKMNLATFLHKRFADALAAEAGPLGEKCFHWFRALGAARAAVAKQAAECIAELNAGGLVG